MNAKYIGPALLAGLAFSMPAMAEGPQLSGVVEIGGLASGYSGSGTYNSGWDNWEETASTGVVHGAARLGFEFTPNFSMQFDGWVNRESYSGTGVSTTGGDYDFSGTDLSMGTAAHLTYWADNGLFAGLVGALGDNDGDGLLGTAGVDFGYFGDTWRLYGQIGLTSGLTDWNGDMGLSGKFAGLVGTYYLNDDLSISGQLQAMNVIYETSSEEIRQVGWGASLDYRPDGMPVVFTIGYEGRNWTYSDGPDSSTSTTHAAYAGIRVPLGVSADKSLKDQDRAHNLTLMDMAYGGFGNY